MNLFDVTRLEHLPLIRRTSRIVADDFRNLDDFYSFPDESTLFEIDCLAAALDMATSLGRPQIWFLGAHPIKLGLSRYVRELIKAGRITHLALTGAALLHDWEIAVHGGTSEDVGQGLLCGNFGMWGESAALAGLLTTMPGSSAIGSFFGALLWASWKRDQPIGVMEGTVDGRPAMLTVRCQCHELSILMAAHDAGIPVTVHSLLGADIWHLTQDFSPSGFGVALWEDFLRFAAAVECLDDGGVFVNVGSAVAGPEVFLKALAMARNVGKGRTPRGFMTAVFDKYPAPARWWQDGWAITPELAEQRWFKNVLVRPRLPDKPGLYIHGHFKHTLPAAYERLVVKGAETNHGDDDQEEEA